MYHELLLALSGVPGDVFREGDDGYRVVPGLACLHPCEEALLNRLCSLGWLYSRLELFILNTSCASLSLDDAGAGKHGMYLRACAAGIDRLLDRYRATLLALEEEVVADAKTPLTRVSCVLDDYYLLLPPLVVAANRLQEEGAPRGCGILQVLHDAANSGMEVVQEAFLGVLATCHAVLLRQAVAWMRTGLLVGDAGEFFVQREIATGAGLVAEQRTILESWNSYVVKPAMLPSYLPLRVADKILFVGKAMLLIRGQRPTTDTGAGRHRPPLRPSEDDYAALTPHLSQLPEAVRGRFDAGRVERIVDDTHQAVSQALWAVLNRETDVLATVQMVHDYFLLGRGELFTAFLDDAQAQLSLPRTASSQYDMQSSLQRAASLLGIEHTEEFQRFTVVTRVAGEPEAAIGVALMDAIGLDCRFPWPLQLLFPDRAVSAYNTMFRFLLSMRHAQASLNQSWQWLRRQIRTAAPSDEPVLADAATLRSQLSVLVNGVQDYIQVDVISLRYAQLMRSLGETTDFGVVLAAHEEFLSEIQGATFRHMKPIREALSGLLRSCGDLAGLTRRAAGPSSLALVELATLKAKVKKQTAFLLQILAASKSAKLAPLLLRLDYNHFFTRR